MAVHAGEPLAADPRGTPPPQPQPQRSGGPDEEWRILTLPNLFTTIRLACIPVFVWLLVRHDRSGWFPAAVLLGALGATDGIDGYLARHLNQVSRVGKVLDPVADRLLLGTAAIAIIVEGAVPTWVAVVAIAREAIVAVGFLSVALAGGRRIDVSWAGKAGTFGLMCALPLFLAGHAPISWSAEAEGAAWAFAIPALAVGWYAALAYIPTARAALKEKGAA
jgi:cardiolipin synthase